MTLIGIPLSLFLLLQSPGAGWVMAPTPPREVRRLYWELQETTEVWVRLTPGDPNAAPPLLSHSAATPVTVVPLAADLGAAVEHDD